MFRKVFNYDNQNEYNIVPKNELNVFENTISACGVLFYRLNNNNIELLLIKYEDKNWPRLDDFGGQIDLEDKNILEVIYREASEETNELIDISKVIKKYNNIKYFYNKKSKYYFMLIEVDNKFATNTQIYGNIEFHDNIKRTISWYNYKEVKNNIAYRLLYCNELINYFDNF